MPARYPPSAAECRARGRPWRGDTARSGWHAPRGRWSAKACGGTSPRPRAATRMRNAARSSGTSATPPSRGKNRRAAASRCGRPPHRCGRPSAGPPAPQAPHRPRRRRSPAGRGTRQSRGGAPHSRHPAPRPSAQRAPAGLARGGDAPAHRGRCWPPRSSPASDCRGSQQSTNRGRTGRAALRASRNAGSRRRPVSAPSAFSRRSRPISASGASSSTMAQWMMPRSGGSRSRTCCTTRRTSSRRATSPRRYSTRAPVRCCRSSICACVCGASSLRAIRTIAEPPAPPASAPPPGKAAEPAADQVGRLAAQPLRSSTICSAGSALRSTILPMCRACAMWRTACSASADRNTRSGSGRQLPCSTSRDDLAQHLAGERGTFVAQPVRSTAKNEMFLRNGAGRCGRPRRCRACRSRRNGRRAAGLAAALGIASPASELSTTSTPSPPVARALRGRTRASASP